MVIVIGLPPIKHNHPFVSLATHTHTVGEFMDKKKLIELVLGNVEIKVNLKGLFDGLIDEVAEPALKEAVAKSETKIDDLVVATLYQPLEDLLKQYAHEGIDEIEKIVKDAIKKALEG